MKVKSKISNYPIEPHFLVLCVSVCCCCFIIFVLFCSVSSILLRMEFIVVTIHEVPLGDEAYQGYFFIILKVLVLFLYLLCQSSVSWISSCKRKNLQLTYISLLPEFRSLLGMVETQHVRFPKQDYISYKQITTLLNYNMRVLTTSQEGTDLKQNQQNKYPFKS